MSFSCGSALGPASELGWTAWKLGWAWPAWKLGWARPARELGVNPAGNWKQRMFRSRGAKGCSFQRDPSYAP